MSTTYSGSPTLVTSITIPVDGDSATANSVNVSSKALFDMQAFLLQTYGQQQQSTSPIRCFVDSPDVILLPIPLIIMSESGTWKSYFKPTNTSIGPSKVEGGGGVFANNAWYYLYGFSNAGTLDFQYSLTPPDSYNLYKNDGTFSFKYITAVRTNNFGQLLELNKYGNFVSSFNGNGLGSSTATTVESTLNTSTSLPPYKTTPTPVTLQIQVTGTTAVSNTLYIKSVAGSTGIAFPLGTALNYSFQVQTITDPTQRLYWQCGFTDLTTTINFSIVSYYE